MASLIPGYEYDIFISYRQNDNKYDGWVTEFVANLNKELEATIKDKVTVYFDANPHDGLLETHSVDRSLEEKLRCLIFIPILSRTYCDPKSYAWNNEFLAFFNIAKEDNIGLNVKLSSGNVSSRVLPVRIHDLNPEDISLVESQIGVIRAVDFIYKEPGVNRPLISNEDNPNDNLNKTHYRNQINKVANSIDEIIRGLRIMQSTSEGVKPKDGQPATKDQKEEKKRESGEDKRGKSKRWRIIALSMLLCIVGVFAIYKVISSWKQAENVSKKDKSIAVLPFLDDSPDKDNEYFCNGMMEEILNQLQKIGDLKVKARTSSERYRNPNKDIKVIGKELGVSLIMEGSVRKIGDDIRIAAQLIDAKTGDHLWSEIYDGKYTAKLLEFQSNIAKKVAASLNAVITPQEVKRIDTKPTTQMVAYDLTLKAAQMIRKWKYTNDSLVLKLSINLVNQALNIDPQYIWALDQKGTIFSHSGNYDSALYYFDKILEIDPENAEGYQGKGVVYFYKRIKPDSALMYCLKADKLAPDNFWINLTIGQVYCMQKNDIVKGLPYFQKAILLGGGSVPEINQQIAEMYLSIDDYPKAEKYFKNAIFANPECFLVKLYGGILLNQRKYIESFHFLDSISSVTLCEQTCDMVRFCIYVMQKDFEKAEKYYNLSNSKGYVPNSDDSLYLAYMYKETGRKKEALTILNNSIKRYEKALQGNLDLWGISSNNIRIAAAYAILNEKTKALKCLYEVERTGPFEIFISIETFPGFDNFLSNPEFQSILKRIEDKKASIREQVKRMELRGEINL